MLPLSVVAFLQPLFETEGIVFPHQETETHGKRDFDFDLLPVLIFTFTFFNAGLVERRQHTQHMLLISGQNLQKSKWDFH